LYTKLASHKSRRIVWREDEVGSDDLSDRSVAQEGGSKLVKRRKVAKSAGAARKTRVGEANAERILDAALEVFSAFGFHGSRIDQVATVANLSKPNLLYYFRTKEDLYTALLRRTLEMWLEPLRELDEKRDPRQALSEYISRKLEYSRDNPEASRLFAMEILQGAPLLSKVLAGELAAIVSEKSETIRRWIAAGKLAPIDPHHLIFAIWATTQHYADFQSQVRAVTNETIQTPEFFEPTRENVIRILLDGALPR
jgi:TetR/AcrR family transcriptional regulator